MPDLFELVPGLKRVSHPLLGERRIIAVGVSAILRHEETYTFEVTRPGHWGTHPDGSRIVGVGGIGGRIEPGESALAGLRREVREELGVGFLLEPADSTALIHDGELVAHLEVPGSPDSAVPYMINLLPPQIPREDRPDNVAIVTYQGRLRQMPRRGDLFGLLMIEEVELETYFRRPEWPLDEALALPGVTFDLSSPLPSGAVIRPTLTGRSFQALLRHSPAG